jgi:hypothetical protein
LRKGNAKMNLDDLPSGFAGSESNESPTSEAWLAERKRCLEDVRLRGDAAKLPFCPPDITIEKVKQGWPAFWKCMREALHVARQKDCPPGLDLEDGLMAMRELEKMVREGFRWLKRVERSPAKTVYDKKRAPQRVARDKERTGRSGRVTLRRRAETIAELNSAWRLKGRAVRAMTSSAAGALQDVASTPVLSAAISSLSTRRGSFSMRRVSPRPERGEKKPAYSSAPAYGWREVFDPGL